MMLKYGLFRSGMRVRMYCNRTSATGKREMMDFAQTAKLKKGIAVTLVTLALGFVVFVLIRNDWAVDVNDLPGALKKALGIRTVAEQQESVLVQLDVTPAKVFKRRLKNGKVVTVVTGEIQNNSRYPMEKVLVEGRLLDAAKNLRVTTDPVPCHRTVCADAISAMSESELKKMYMEGDEPFNCVIKSGFSAPFMVMFDTLPSNFNVTFKFEVHPHSGQFLE